MKAVARRGTVIVVGLMGGSLPLSVPLLPLTAMTLTGSYVGSPAEMTELMALARAGKIPALPVERRPLGEAQKTLDDMKAVASSLKYCTSVPGSGPSYMILALPS